MLFNSIAFAIFLPITFILYWFVVNKNLKLQNFFLLVASYIFYGWWDWHFLSLIFISSLVDYLVGLGLEQNSDKTKRKLLLYTSLLVNLGFLGFFKYFNFFIDSFIDLFASIGIVLQTRTLNIILPVGISFYTFQTLSYTIDIYNNKLRPTKNIISFFAFVSFFPQLIAGPIERARNLLPQFNNKRKFVYKDAVDGMRQILWGLFKKVVIADNTAKYVDNIFSNYPEYSGSTLMLGAIFFAIQIYCDYSGYSDIALGTARLFGFNLMRNFAYPFFARDVGEFWRNWNISLSSWFRDYLYIPLGGSRGSHWFKLRNILIVFILIGLWHGSGWPYVAWGLLTGLYFIPLILRGKGQYTGMVAQDALLPSFKELLQMSSTFLLYVIALPIFALPTVKQGVMYLSNMFSLSLFSIPQIKPHYLITLIILFIITEWLQRNKQHGLQFVKIPLLIRWGAYYILILLVLYYFSTERVFFYFQF